MIYNVVMKHAIVEALKETLTELGYQEHIDSVFLERPADMTKGDFAANIALVLSKKVGKSPLALSIALVDALKERGITGVEKIEVAGPGFINFHVTRSVIKESILKILSEGDVYGHQKRLVTVLQGTGKSVPKKMVYEYTDPNPFKVFHIGHLMANTIGESLARISETQGAEVKRFCYQGDVGRHVALTIWGLRFMPSYAEHKETGASGKGFLPNESDPLTDRVAFFGKAYALGATAYKKAEDTSKESGQVDSAGLANSEEFLKIDGEVQTINKAIYFRTDPEINEIYDLGKEWSLEHFEELYKILGTTFDQYFFESKAAIEGIKTVQENTAPKGKKVFEESNGAIVFPGEKYGLHTRVFITRQGLPAYEGKEIGLAPMKYKAFPYDIGITVTANEQSEYFKVVNKAIGLLFEDFGTKVKHIAHGMLKLTTGKMSSRTGDVISGESLIGEMIDLALEKMKDREISEQEKKKTAEQVAVAAIKFTVLRQAIGKDVIFDPEKSLSFEGDSGPYLQYSCVRAKSVLDKAQKEGIVEVVDSSDTTIVESETFTKLSKLENLLVRYPEILEKASEEESPHVIATFLMELALAFNSFYASVPIVKIDDFESRYKVAVVRAFSIVMRNGLTTLGIQVPAKM